ncbi:hypothetical protein COBT_000907 [Conglomerata obtusa]
MLKEDIYAPTEAIVFDNTVHDILIRANCMIRNKVKIGVERLRLSTVSNGKNSILPLSCMKIRKNAYYKNKRESKGVEIYAKNKITLEPYEFGIAQTTQL